MTDSPRARLLPVTGAPVGGAEAALVRSCAAWPN
jgi:hypothetical protein